MASEQEATVSPNEAPMEDNITSANSAQAAMMDFPMDNSIPLTPSDDKMDGSLFFADATLDLDEAHDIAETPEPRKIPSSRGVGAQTVVELPKLSNESGVGAQPETASNTEKASTDGTVNRQIQLNRISNANGPGERPLPTSQPTYRPRPPRRPRDVPWLVGFFLFVPISMMVCSSLSRKEGKGSPVALSKTAVSTIFYSLVMALGATLALARLLYRTTGGGDGDDARHVASQVILAFAPISLAVYPLLMLCIYLKTPHALGYALIPLIVLVRDLWTMRQLRTTASTAGGRQAFFQAITNMALDILSRSLRRSSFSRIVVVILALQFVIIWWWKAAILGALGHGSSFWLLVALVAGKWATGTVARVLGFIAAGGVTSWFVQQSIIMEEMEALQASQQSAPTAESDHPVGSSANMPEEYRSVDASAYQPVLDVDEGVDDDDEDDTLGIPTTLWTDSGDSTVKTFLVSAVTISFGSIAQCGLLGGLAQFVWNLLRKMEAAKASLAQRMGPASRRGFRGMQIGQEGFDGTSLIWKILSRVSLISRNFVKNHTDLAMSQVAAYYKSYRRAAQDVNVLVEGSGKFLLNA